MSGEALLICAYALFLLAAAVGLDRLAQHSHRRSERYRTAGFEFRRDLDVWECPEGEFLRRIDTDHVRRLVRYRARAAVCNACPAKAECTDSDHGRELVHSLDPWPHSEAGRFHRGICVVLAVLAALLAAVGLARSSGAAEVLALATTLAMSIALASRLLASFRRTPSGFAGAAVPDAIAAIPEERSPAAQLRR
jgi:hypothetical protein